MRREKSSKKGLNNRVNERPKSLYVRAPLPVRTHSGFSFEKRLMRISLQNRVVSFRCVCVCAEMLILAATNQVAPKNVYVSRPSSHYL